MRTVRILWELFGPPVHFAITLGGIFGAQRLKLMAADTGWSPVVSYLSLLVVLGSEIAFSRYFEGRGRFSRAIWPGAVFRCLFWICVLYGVVEWPSMAPSGGDEAFIRTELHPVNFAYRVRYLLGASPIVSAVGAGLAVLSYALLTVRRRKMRGLAVFVMPALVVGNGLLFQYFGITLHSSDEKISAQEGVDLFFAARDVEDPELRRVWSHPRTIYVDSSRDAIFASFGQTLGRDVHDKANFWKIDMKTRGYRTLNMCQLRAFTRDDADPFIYAAPWHSSEILKISKDRFDIVDRFNYGDLVDRLRPLAPHSMVKRGEDLFVTGAIGNVVFRYRLGNGRITGLIDFDLLGLAKAGSEVGTMMYVGEPRLLVLGVGLGSHIILIDPDTFIVKTIVDLPGAFTDLPSNPGHDGAFLVSPAFGGVTWKVHLNDFSFEPVVETAPTYEVRYDDLEGTLYYLEYLGGKLTVHSVGDEKSTQSVLVGGRPYSMYRIGDTIYVLSSNGVVRVDKRGLKK